jgi:hypothetical protein
MSRLDGIRARLTELQKNYPKAESKLETRYRVDGTKVQTGASGHEIYLHEASEDIAYLLELIDQIQKRAEPLRYAVSHLQSDTEKDAIISADAGYMYTDDDDRYLRLPDLTALLFDIYYGGEG